MRKYTCKNRTLYLLQDGVCVSNVRNTFAFQFLIRKVIDVNNQQLEGQEESEGKGRTKFVQGQRLLLPPGKSGKGKHTIQEQNLHPEK